MPNHNVPNMTKIYLNRKRCLSNIFIKTILRKASTDRVLHLLLVIHILMRLHGVLRLVLLHAESADKGLVGGGVLV